MNSGPDERPHPGGGHPPDEFEAIVAGLRQQGPVPDWPDDEADLLFDAGPDPAPAAAPPPPPAGPRDQAPAVAPEDDHFVPPEPPPLPRIGPPAAVGLALLALGLVLVLVPGWVGVGVAYGLPLGLLTLTGGLGWLVLRLWPDPTSRPGDGDDGAIL